ncbi:inositol 1,4,5-trisphosphate receptor-interacting protein [Protobothrops mucrosquamatus]|uniref:inositol 1,4,5-trisphosphate receptor-interacting protein n=1 Tax=Protobothrops mucrosquamatus TaxID=103944 RepID=UPI0007758792|nr:inositol 1,4,5-trisphosphate receptor-interacting protein [Protobothrops mucrosquamatus]
MPAGFFRVCLVVITAIVNHPFLFPKENVTVFENTEEIIEKMKEREENLRLEQLKLEQELAAQEVSVDSSEEKTGPEKQYDHDSLSWNFWTALSMIVFLLIEFWRQDYQEGNWQDYTKEDDEINVLGRIFKGFILPDKVTLDSFYERCLQNMTSDIARNRELVEGFADDLLEALRSMCNRDTDMEVEESIGVGSMYENWRANKPFTCDFIVPFNPPEPYCFQFETWCSGESVLPDKESYGMIKISRTDDNSSSCICDKTKLGEDLLCLLHSKVSQSRQNNHVEDLLCFKDTQYLDSDQVMTWFQMALTRGWNKIAHKYEFSLIFNHLDAPGELGVPVEFQKAEPLNLFRPFVLERSTYRKTMDMFHEMLKNTSALINEYSMHVPNGQATPLNKELL